MTPDNGQPTPMPACGLQQPFANVVIRASAGTGKTFQLSNRFLALVHAGERPDHLIAATFARKAAGEILERVLLRLAEAATDPVKRQELAGFIEKEAGGAPLTADRCVELLRQLTAHLHRLRIGTLDSLFVQMANSFAFELGLPPGWRIVDDVVDRRVRDAAVQEMLANSPASAVVTLMHLLHRGEVRRAVSQQVRSVTDGLHSIYCEAAVETWDCLPRLAMLTEAELGEAIDRLADIDDLPANIGFRKGYASDLEQARAGDWQGFLYQGVAAKVAAGESQYYNKDIPGALVAAYRPLVKHAQAFLVGRLIDQTRATCTLLKQFDEAYERLKHRERALRFDDVTRALGRGLRDGGLGELAFRMDLHACQLLLDEFQDTSLPQWQVLRPMVERAAREQGRSFFCVGDLKQAIYGWRGGVSELFDVLDRQIDDVQTIPLDQSFRSSLPVIHVVNEVFGSLAACPVLAKYPRVTQAWAERFRAHSTAKELTGYVRLESGPAAEDADTEVQRRLTLEHAAALAARLHREHPGRTIGILVRKNTAVARLIYELRKRHQLTASEEGGNPLTDSAGVQLILSLLTLADHPGHTVAAYHVARSPLGEALGFTDHTAGDVARRLARDTRAALVHRGYGPTLLDWVRKLAPACDSRELSRLAQLVALGYRYEPDATERPDDFVRFVRATRVEDPLSADVRVMTVHQAKGLEFDIVILPELDTPFCGPPWPQVLVGRPTPTEPIDAVCRYPQADVRNLLPPRFQQMYEDWEYLEANEDLCVLYVAMTRAIHALYLVIPPSRPNEKTLQSTPANLLRTALCGTDRVEPQTLLYEHGAFDWDAREAARAGSAEPVIAGRHVPSVSGAEPDTTRTPTRPRSRKRPQTTTGFQQRQLPFGPAAANDGGADGAGNSGSPEASRARTASPLAAPVDEDVAVTPLIVRLADSPARRSRSLERRSPSDLQGGTVIRLEKRLYVEPSVAAERGSLWHLWLEQIEWLGDGSAEPDDDLLRHAARSFSVAGLDLTAELAEFRRLLNVPAVRAVFQRSAYAGTDAGWPRSVTAAVRSGAARLTADREFPFAIREQNSVLNGAIDRLVIARDESGPLAAEILDFKTDQIGDDPKRLDERAGWYAPQLAGYRRAVAAILSLPESAVTARLVFLRPGVVRRM